MLDPGGKRVKSGVIPHSPGKGWRTMLRPASAEGTASRGRRRIGMSSLSDSECTDEKRGPPCFPLGRLLLVFMRSAYNPVGATTEQCGSIDIRRDGAHWTESDAP